MNNDSILANCMKAARAGGEVIRNYRPLKAKEKGDVYVGHHAVVTEADFMSQEAVLKQLRNDADAYFVTEEHVKDPDFSRRLMQTSDMREMPNRRVYVIDELDGSSSFNLGHYEWSVSVGAVERMMHVAGAVYAPKIEDGLMFGAMKDAEAFVQKGSVAHPIRVSGCRKMKKAYIIHGTDCVLTKYPVHNRLMNVLGDASRTTNMTGSCAIGMSIVAAGRADALIQPLHSPWDWAAGKVILEEAGGVMLFYEMEGENNAYGKIIPIEKPVPRHYNPEERALGFVAVGSSELAEDIMKILFSLQ